MCQTTHATSSVRGEGRVGTSRAAAWRTPCLRAVRGGSWNNNPRNARNANRNRNTNDDDNVGFRLASTPPCPSSGSHGRRGRAEGAFRVRHDDKAPDRMITASTTALALALHRAAGADPVRPVCNRLCGVIYKYSYCNSGEGACRKISEWLRCSESLTLRKSLSQRGELCTELRTSVFPSRSSRAH